MVGLQAPLVANLLLAVSGVVVAAALLWGARRWLPPTSRVRIQMEKLGAFRGGDAVLAIVFIVGGLALTIYYS